MAYLDETGLEALWGDIEELVDGVTISDGGVTTTKLADGAVTDAKLAQSGGVLEKVNSLKSAFDSLGVIEHKSINLADPSKLETGTLSKNGTISESGRKYTDYIDVTNINKIYFYYGSNAAPFNYTNICAYDSEKNVLPNAGIDDNNTQVTYTVPSGVAYIRATVQSAFITKFMITASTATVYEAYFDPYTEYTKDMITDETKSKIDRIGLSKVWELYNEAASISDGDTLRITPVPHTATNVTYSFNADITTFNKITFGRDPSKSYATYIELTDTKVSFCLNVFGSISKSTYDHNLTIANHISLIIAVGDKRSEAKVRITTVSGVYEATINFNGNNGDVYLSSTGTTMTNVSIRMASARWYDSHVLYWDSYESFVGQHMTDLGAHLLYDGYPGRTAAGGKNSFDKMMTIYKPSVVIWGLGMNNGDSSSAINADWLTVAQYIKGVCAENSITLIFLTIPNTPTIRNTYKNTWIKSSSECPYIDVADAVGANAASSTWYTGLLTNDNVHPTQQGSKVIAAKICASLPEIIK